MVAVDTVRILAVRFDNPGVGGSAPGFFVENYLLPPRFRRRPCADGTARHGLTPVFIGAFECVLRQS
jgi:hypothetical protein